MKKIICGKKVFEGLKEVHIKRDNPLFGTKVLLNETYTPYEYKIESNSFEEKKPIIALMSKLYFI